VSNGWETQVAIIPANDPAIMSIVAGFKFRRLLSGMMGYMGGDMGGTDAVYW